MLERIRSAPVSCSTTLLAAVAFLASLSLVVSPAAAAVDIEGPWYVRVEQDLGGPAGTDFVNHCHWGVTHSGTTFAASFSCTSAFGPYTGTYAGTIDPDAGTFAAPEPFISCASGTGMTGTAAPDSSSFSGEIDCPPFRSITFVASKCRNGVIDGSEACDLGIDVTNADCCTDACTVRPTGDLCGGDDGDGNACTSRQCDGSAAACPVAIDPLPAGTACGERAGCEFPACDGAGSCNTTATVPDGGFCHGQCFKGQGTCQAGACLGAERLPTGTACRADGNLCTVDTCDATGTCTAGPCSECCDDSGGSCVPAYDASCEHPAVAKAKVSLGYGRGNIAWTWTGGDEAEFESITTGGGSVCVYDGEAKELIAVTQATGGTGCGNPPCWKSNGVTSRYKATKTEPLRALILREGVGTKAMITARATRVPYKRWEPSPSFEGLMTPVRVQLKGADRCWESTFTTARKNVKGAFIATGGSPSGAFIDPVLPGF